MKIKEITIAGKQVTLAYCFATEISFKTLTDCDLNPFMVESVETLGADKMPDVKKRLCAILAAAIAYADSKNEESPIDDKLLMNEADPEEFNEAFGVVIGLWMQFYHIPTGEPQEKKQKGRARKN